MISEQLQELASLHALGALPPEEARAFEDQLRRDPELRAFYNGLQNVTDALALSAKAAAPSAELKQRILAATEKPAREKIVSFPRPRAERNPFSIFIPWALAASFALIAGILFWQNATSESLSRQKIALLQTALDELRAKDRVSEVRIAMLNSLLADSPKAMAVSVWDAEKQNGVLVVQNLAPLPADKDYQLWVIDPQQKAPVDAGVFSVDDKGTVRFHFKPKSGVNVAGTFAVTLEKKGGVVAPEGKMVLAGNLL